MARCAYDMLAIDLDGTLLDERGGVSDANVRAVRAAREAGVRVVVCTGRGHTECVGALRAIDQQDPVVVAGGSIIADASSGRTLTRFPMDRQLAHDMAGLMVDHGHAALVFKDASEAGFEYLVVDGGGRSPLHPVTSWWFAHHGVRVRRAATLHEDEHQEHTVRVGACAPAEAFHALHELVKGAAGARGVVHNFPAVISGAHGHGVTHILEVFDATATKWTALSHLAAQWGVPAERVCAIGDQVNDVAMIEGAGLGIAMGNAVPEVVHAAQRQTRSNTQDGVAHAIEQLLSGAW